MRRYCFIFAAAAVAAIAFGLAACGGSDPAPSAGGPTPANHAPVAVIGAATTLQAGQALAVDGSASTDADGDALTYTWDFGDGGKGGGAKLAHIYTAAGPYTVTLTVADGHGGTTSTTQVTTVSGGAVAAAPASVTGRVGDRAGPLSGVTAQLVGGSASGTTDAAGKVVLQLPTGVPLVIRLSKTGYADQWVPVDLPPGTPEAIFKAGMLLRAAAQDFDAAAGGTVAGNDGANVTFAANALVDGAGHAVTGSAQIALTPIDVRDAGVALFPGAYAGVDATGATQPIASHGTVEFALTQGGQKLQIAAGKTATIELPIYAGLNLDGTDIVLGQVIPLWSLDEGSGMWVQEGNGSVVASTASPSGLAMRATVGHFSWWNTDALIAPPQPYQPQPHCFLNPGPEFAPIPKPCSLGPLLPGEYRVGPFAERKHTLALPAGYRRTPSYAVRADIPAIGGISLPLPANLDYVFYACSSDGLYCGKKLVHGAPGVVEAVTITLDPISAPADCSAPTVLTLPSNQDFAISDPTAASCFTFPVSAGQVLALSTTPNNGSQLTGNFQLIDPSGAILGTGAFDSSANAQTLRRIASATGTYKVKVTALPNSPAGGFHLSLAASTPTALAVPSPAVTVTLNSDLDAGFDIAAGQVLALSVLPHDLSSAIISSLVDGSTRTVLPSSSDDSYAAFTFRSASAAQAGFHLERGQLAGNSPQAIVTLKPVVPIAFGDLVAGSIPKGHEVTSYAFDANAGDIAFATAVSDATGNGEGVPVLRIFDTQTQDFNPGLYNVSTQWRAGPYTLPATGSYRLDVFANIFVAAPNYSLRVVKVAAPVAVVPTGAVTTVNGSIDAIGEQRYYTVALTQGDVIRLTVLSPDALGLLFEALSPDATKPFYARTPFLSMFTTRADNTGLNSHAVDTQMVRVTQTGDYTLHVMANSSRLVSALGSYSFTLQNPVAAALAPSTQVADTLAAPFGVKRYSVVIATAGDYRFCFRSPGWVQDELRAPDGTSLVQTTNRSIGFNPNPEFVQTLAAGTYTYDVFSMQSAATTFDVIYRPAADAHAACQ